MYDAIFILGGSYIDEKTLPSWVIARLEQAIALRGQTARFIVLSRGTPHKPPCLTQDGFPIDECSIMAQYLVDKGIPKGRIYKDAWSLDTIGNAYAALTMHAIPLNLRKIIIITSDFHMPRTRSIFSQVFSLLPMEIFTLKFLETKSELPISKKEERSLTQWEERSKRIHTLYDLHQFMFKEHKAYNVGELGNQGRAEPKEQDHDDMLMYCI
jgi:uncharacterized SAM-binding protein YcdF (DUF218 family)